MTAIQTEGPHSPFTERKTHKIRDLWDNLQGQEHDIDFERAKLLHEVWTRYDKNDEQTELFMTAFLGVFPGKRPKMFTRFVHAFDVDDTPETWQAIGGRGMILLTRLRTKRQRRKVMTRIRKALRRTGRSTVSRSCFRNSLRETVGDEVYKSTLSEPSERRSALTLRQELATLRGFILTLIQANPDLQRGMPRKVKKLLGADLLD